MFVLLFQSTPSAWRETLNLRFRKRTGPDFNPLPPHGGRQARGGCYHSCDRISIHSLRMEGDVAAAIDILRGNTISIHSLRMEGDYRCTICKRMDCAFQSTPSAWRETNGFRKAIYWSKEFQSTPSAWRETDSNGNIFHTGAGISIHSLRMEGDIPFWILFMCRG